MHLRLKGAMAMVLGRRWHNRARVVGDDNAPGDEVMGWEQVAASERPEACDSVPRGDQGRCMAFSMRQRGRTLKKARDRQGVMRGGDGWWGFACSREDRNRTVGKALAANWAAPA